MLHYSCDFCQRPIDPSVGIRHVVKINVFPAVDSQNDENCTSESESLGDDHFDDMHDLLERLEEQDLADRTAQLAVTVYKVIDGCSMQ